jgi:hypothetical protein
MKRVTLILIYALAVSAVCLLIGALLFLRAQAEVALASLPTIAVLPTDTPAEITALNTATTTATFTPSATNSATPTNTPTPTNTLATLVLHVTSVNADVAVQPISIAMRSTETPAPLPTIYVPTPEAHLPTPPPDDVSAVGWYEYDMADPRIVYAGDWRVYERSWHSMHKRYMYSDTPDARLTLRFLGAGVRIRYVKYYTYGVFQVRLDGKVVTTIDSYYPRAGQGENGDFTTSDVFALPHGWHTLEIVSLGQKHPQSDGIFIAFDGIDVYRNGAEPTATSTAQTSTPYIGSTPVSARRIELVAAPPTIIPTPTDAPPAITSVNLSVAYDRNNNKVADADEGVQGVSVRMITVNTNEVVASAYTNGEGYVRLEATGNVPLRLVVPYFNRFWDVPLRSNDMQISLLVPPANQPGLIP